MLLRIVLSKLLIHFFGCSVHFSALIIVWWENFLFWSNLFCVLYASCMLIDIAFFRLVKFSSMILLKVFPASCSWESFPSYMLGFCVCLFVFFFTVCSFHHVPDFFNVLCHELFRSSIFFDLLISSYHIFYT